MTWISKTVLSSRKKYLANPKNGRIEEGRKDERTELSHRTLPVTTGDPKRITKCDRLVDYKVQQE